MDKHYKLVDMCRVCESKALRPVLSLGNQYVSNFVDSPSSEALKVPLDLVLCPRESGGCGLLQLRHTTSPELLYEQYWYKSGINRMMRDALADVVRKAEELVGLSPGDVVLDIGCNDGTLLRSYTAPNLMLVGFEPAKNLVDEASIGATRLINEFFSSKAFERNFRNRKARIITAIAMFYDLDDPNAFVSDVAKILDKEGVFIIQMNYLASMLEKNAFDNICHEHLEYYSLESLRYLLERHGLEVFDVELNDVNGGSFRAYIRHADNSLIVPFDGGVERLKKVEQREQSLGLHTRKPYAEFAARVNDLKGRIRGFIQREVRGGRTVFLYGASTKGNTLLQFFELDNTLIRAAAERNPEKWGKRTVGTLIPILSEEEARRQRPDYFLVLPWHFIEEFRERERVFLEGGGKFLVPLPEFRMVSARDV